MFEFIFWQNIVSPHQAATLRAIRDLGHRVTVVADESLSASRKLQGWQPPTLEGCRVFVAPEDVEIQRIVRESPSDAIHVLAGAQIGDLGKKVVAACTGRAIRLGIVSESPDSRGALFFPRLLKYTWGRMRFGFRFDFALAMGDRGVRWFQRCGYRSSKVFPFLYTVDVGRARLSGSLNSGAFRMCFAGQLIQRKGIDVLLRAAQKCLRDHSFRLAIIGAGAKEDALRRTSSALGIQDWVSWEGRLSSSATQKKIGDSDLFVLPSREDGWGAVVNEALMMGTPVICSDACGAADLIQHEWLGSVFPTENVGALAREIKKWASLGPLDEGRRARIRNWADCISGESAAKYFISVLNHVYRGEPRPVPPWRCPDLPS